MPQLYDQSKRAMLFKIYLYEKIAGAFPRIDQLCTILNSITYIDQPNVWGITILIFGKN